MDQDLDEHLANRLHLDGYGACQRQAMAGLLKKEAPFINLILAGEMNGKRN